MWPNTRQERPLKSRRTAPVCSRSRLRLQELEPRIAPTGEPGPFGHDPSAIQQGNWYYLFNTGGTIPIQKSTDLIHWQGDSSVFATIPAWVHAQLPQALPDIWAPDISYFDGVYHLYYAVSSSGSNDSVIGLATNVTLDRSSPSYRWVDRGMVLRSYGGQSNFNAIDPNAVLDTAGNLWLDFGSFFSGIKMRQLDRSTGLLSAGNTQTYSLAARPSPDAIEGPAIFRHDNYYYLFASIGYCCRGVNSTYEVVVGRSATITGPYLDRSGQRLDQGGGTLVLSGYDNVRGPGGESVFQDAHGVWLVHHFYDANDNGLAKVQFRPLVWSPDDWPLAGGPHRGLPPLTQDITTGTWLQSVNFGAEIGLRFYPDGRINDPNGPDYWTLQGNVLTMHWPDPHAPGGEWVDTCILSADGRWLAGRNQANTVVRARRSALPGGWTDGDIGSPGIPGYAYDDSVSGIWTVAGGGSDIWNTSDQFHFASENLAGDGSIVARVTAVPNTDPSAKAGVMFRDSTNPRAVFADVVATPGNGVNFQWRATSGGVPNSVNVPGITAPVWVELARVGNTFNAFYSSDGNAWTPLGSAQAITMNTVGQAGLAVTAHNNGRLNASTFANVSVLPSGWTARDVGGPGLPGSSSYDANSGTWSVAGGGADIWNTADQFRFTYQSFTGDGEIVARVAAVGNTGPFAKVGVMIRESLAVNSRHALVDVTPTQGVEFIRRTATGANAVSNFDPGVAAPSWVRLLRRGSTFAAFDSPDGATWHLVGSVDIPMGNTVYAGLAVCAFNNQAVNAATFSNVSVLPHVWSLPPGWGDSDVGSPGRPGYADFNPDAGTWTVGGSGADIAGTADQFHFVSRGFPGDATLTARVASVTNTDPWAKAGVMFRDSADPSAVFADVLATSGNGVIFEWRDAPGGPTDKFQVAGLHAPVWVQLVRAGDVFGGYFSTDGITWVQVGSTHMVVMSPTALAGLAVTSHNNSTLNAATFTHVSLLPTGWSDADIGSPGQPGYADFNADAGTWAVGGGGADIFGTADAFHFLYQPLTGDGEVVARVTGEENTGAYAKAGVMIRETLDAGSRHALVDVTPRHGAELIRRTATGGNSTSTFDPAALAPYWVRLVRQGDTFAAYDSPDGVNWNLITITTISMAQTVYAGLAVCAFNNGRLSAATFDNVSVVAQADLSAAFNQTAAVSDGTPFAGGLDGNGDAYSATLLGSMLPANGYDFNLGAANGANAVQATGQTVSLPAGQFSVLSFLGTGVNGPQPGQTFVVNYADGSSDTFAVDMSDWLSPQGYMGEAIAAALSYYDWLDGSPVAVTNYLYQYNLIVNNQQTVSSIALPANGNVVILAIDLNVLGPAGQPPFASPHGPSAGRISALVPGVQNRNPWATAAGMFREGGAPFADVLVIPGNCAAFAGRHTPSKRPANANVTGQVDPSPAATDRAGITPTAWTPHRRAEVLDVVLAELDNGVSLVERECDQ